MRRKFIQKIITAIIILQLISFNINTVNGANGANQQPAVCNGPSEMMTNYFNFQNDMKAVLLGSDIEEKRYNVYVGKGWLFSNGTLNLPSALDFVSSNIIGEGLSTAYTAGASIVILLMASKSVFQSNTEGFAILFKDRPIVRDYKTMLDIETELFNLAYFRSKQMNLSSKLEKKETYDNLNKVIEKYQGLGLLYKGEKLQGTESLAKILEELISINSAMKHFILFWGAPGTKALKNYNGCFGNVTDESCKNSPILKFASGAIDKLVEDYSGIGTFGACNLTFSNFKNSIKKSVNNNSDSVKAAFNDVKTAINNLQSALLGQSSDGNTNSNSKDDRCSNMSEYEIAQLRAYWGPKWTCGSIVDASIEISLPKEFIRDKAAENKQRKKTNSLLKKSASTNITDSDTDSYKKENLNDIILKQLLDKKGTEEIEDYRFQMYGYGTGERYNTGFIFDFAKDLTENYSKIMGDYNQTQRNASSSDLSNELKGIKGLLNQLDKVIKSSTDLEAQLEKVAKYQCIF